MLYWGKVVDVGLLFVVFLCKIWILLLYWLHAWTRSLTTDSTKQYLPTEHMTNNYSFHTFWKWKYPNTCSVQCVGGKDRRTHHVLTEGTLEVYNCKFWGSTVKVGKNNDFNDDKCLSRYISECILDTHGSKQVGETVLELVSSTLSLHQKKFKFSSSRHFDHRCLSTSKNNKGNQSWMRSETSSRNLHQSSCLWFNSLLNKGNRSAVKKSTK